MPSHELDDSASCSDSDLETDFRHIEKPKISDLKGRELYARLCTKYGIVPMKSLVHSIENECVRNCHSGMGVPGARAMSAPLCASKNLRVLQLEDSMLGSRGAIVVSRILHVNSCITEIDLSFNNIGSAGTAHLCSAIRHSVALARVILTGNEFEDNDAEWFAEVIEHNPNIKEFGLGHNRLGQKMGQLMGAALVGNDTLEWLDLSWNHFRLRGARDLSQGIGVNRGLKVLNLSMNGFATEGSSSLSQALITNKYLEDLDISFNRISTAAAVEFSKCLRINRDLKVLKIQGNPIINNGTLELVTAIAANSSSSIQLLDVAGLVVQKDFHETVAEIQKTRSFEARTDLSTPSHTVTRQGDCSTDSSPLEILFTFLKEKNMRLKDLFKSFSKDRRTVLSRREFSSILKEVQISLSSAQLEKLLNMVDDEDDDEIDLRKMEIIGEEFKSLQ